MTDEPEKVVRLDDYRRLAEEKIVSWPAPMPDLTFYGRDNVWLMTVSSAAIVVNPDIPRDELAAEIIRVIEEHVPNLAMIYMNGPW